MCHADSRVLLSTTICKYFSGVSDVAEGGIIEETGVQGKAICVVAVIRRPDTEKGLDLLSTDDISELEYLLAHASAMGGSD